MGSVMAVSYINTRMPVSPKAVTIRQKYGNHTVALIDYRHIHRAKYVVPVEDTPVKIVHGATPFARSTYGYVNHYDTLVTEDRRTVSRVVVVGTSKPMNSVYPSEWADTTRSSVAREIAKRHRLRSVIHQHDEVVPSWSTGVLTDFQALQKLGAETGFSVWVDGATLYFLDPYRVLRSAESQSIPTFHGSQVRRATVIGGAGAPRESGQSKRRVIYGLDYRTNELFSAESGDPLNPTTVSEQRVDTYSEAQSLVAAASRRDSDYYTFKAVLAGDARVTPGTLILVTGNVTSDQAGIWLVNEAEHTVTQEDYETRVVAVRAANQQPVISTTNTLRHTNETSPATVRDGRLWEATVQEHALV